MQDKKTEVLTIYRLLSPRHRADLLAWVQLAYAAEKSVRKSLGFDVQPDGGSSLKSQEYSSDGSSLSDMGIWNGSAKYFWRNRINYERV